MADAGPLIKVRDLRFETGGKLLLNIGELDITSCGPTMVLGPNGAGKSLLLRLLHGLIQASSGSITIDGQRLDIDTRKRQAMVFQTPVLLRRSVAANVDYALKVHHTPRSERPARIVELLETGQLGTMARQSARTLSGGEQQRLALVRALANRPQILFLDEPTSSLDPGATRDIEALLTKVVGTGTKVIMVTHDLGAAQRLGEDVVFLRKGQVVEKTPAELFFKTPTSDKARKFLANRLVL